MRTIQTCVCLAMFVLAVATQPAIADAKKSVAALQGTWKLVSVEIDGEEVDHLTSQPQWTIKEGRVIYGGEPLAELKVDPDTTPTTIDLAFVKPKRTCEGIFEIDGDKLKLCINRRTDGVRERPSDFSTEGKSDLRLFIFERLKDAGKDPLEGVSGFVGMAIRVSDEDKGILIEQVIEDSPAEKAGLKKDDQILKVGDAEPTDLKAVVEAVRKIRPGEKVTIRVLREGKEHDIGVKAGVMPFPFLD